ncbi:MAG: amino acid adenylation domain-containing protein, partial [Halanaerobiales bacterium]|nr:amino acid adenylation domain-containing protein [Halanaerobiales bacterium]
TNIIVGSPIVGRDNINLNNIVGMFVNTLAMSNYPEGEKSFNSFLTEVKENSLKAYENQDYQFEDLVDQLGLDRELSRNPLFDTMFVMQNMDIKEVELDDLEIKPYKFASNIAKFDLAVTAVEEQEEVLLNISYSTELFKKETIERLSKHYKNVIDEVIENTEIKLAEIEILSKEEREQILYEFNDTKAKYPKDETIHVTFEEQVEKRPYNIALVYEDERLTYRRLNEKANQLARLLREKGVGPEKVTGIMIERSSEMIIAILAILKAGGAYLPIDSEYPKSRIEFMLKDGEVDILLTERSLMEEMHFDIESIDIKAKELYQGDGSNLSKITSSNNLAYIIYTSGSTGTPKGVMIEHRGVLNLKGFLKRVFDVTEKDRILQFANISFDASVQEIFSAVLHGASLYVVAKNVIGNYSEFENFLNENEITIASLMPTYAMGLNYDSIKTVRLFITGGAESKQELVDKCSGRSNYINLYGPTEATVIASYWKADGLHRYSSIQIGTPIENTQIYILDNHDNLQPIGAPGELCIAGEGLARGYLKRPDLTVEKFVDNPFGEGKMYRTGDLARFLPDGNIEFLGRVDLQVKIRGFRIELGEIENKLLNNKYIKDSIVLAKEDADGNKYLVGYIVAEKNMSLSELRKFLSDELPNYMIPSYFVQLDEFPLNKSGKVDRKVLNEIEDRIGSDTDFEKPRNQIEEELSEIWKEVLGVYKISINDNFFNIGGHSLKAILLIKEINRKLNKVLALTEIFNDPTIKGLSKALLDSSDRVSSFDDNNLMLLRSGSNQKKNIFFVHDGSGETGSYVELTDQLKFDGSVYGIEFDGLSQYGPENISIDKMCKNYINKIKTVQKNGPYYIAGWSLGGTLAFELARQLETIGDEVPLLLMIDTLLIHISTSQGYEYSADTEKEFVKTLFKKDNLISYLEEVKSSEEVWEKAIHYAEENAISESEVKENMYSTILQIIPGYGRDSIEKLIYYINVIRTLHRVRNLYIPSNPINSTTYFFKPTEEKRENLEEWNKYIKQSIEIVEVPGNHFSVMKSPHVATLADEINKIINNCL